MLRHGNVADDAAYWAEKGDATLAETVVDFVVGETGDEVPYEGDDEEGGNDSVVDVVVFFDLNLVSMK